MELRYLPDPIRTRNLTTSELRAAFLAERLFEAGQANLIGVDVDRAVVGGAIPTSGPLSFETPPEWKVDSFCARREMGLINIGGPGSITVDNQRFAMAPRECLYVSQGSKRIVMESDSAANPAAFYMASFPAFAPFPTTKARLEDARRLDLGKMEDCNRRTIRQYIHPDGIKSCQLVMGFTTLEPGSIWNTMPAHTHERRCEIYLYFDVDADARVFHMMGAPEETRHLLVANRQAVFSPSWSIHSGAGTRAYSFIWAMGGENQRFDDMQSVSFDSLR